MAALGFRPVVRSEDVAVMGITEVVRHMPRIYREYRRLKASIAAEKPDAAVLIDFPDVNLSLAKHLSRQGVPVIYFVSPQLWAWKKHRIRSVQKYVDRMLVIFPVRGAVLPRSRRGSGVCGASARRTRSAHGVSGGVCSPDGAGCVQNVGRPPARQPRQGNTAQPARNGPCRSPARRPTPSFCCRWPRH